VVVTKHAFVDRRTCYPCTVDINLQDVFMPARQLIAAAVAFGLAATSATTSAATSAAQEAASSAPSAAAPDYERIGRFIYAFFRAGGGDAQDLGKPGRADGVPPDLAARAHRLTVRFDAAVEMADAMPDAELRAILDEAAAVHAAIAAWRGT